ncbi:hypothetical protein ACIBI9_50220 [Nonomuraea sp. NPDC050451]
MMASLILLVAAFHFDLLAGQCHSRPGLPSFVRHDSAGVIT